ncbi:MAG: tRNA (adenosine(37)-N6)-threonylcarbamoyltransferase complex ATPase subunit type 1 TsaE [Alphaproteobacteria bacterium]|nr:tRNA (adenosine(37)-N6)-threonylcarbamoyltransferase complex ATPase subunit type 1 TsaE [Alphaproteobacteria bacterium]
MSASPEFDAEIALRVPDEAATARVAEAVARVSARGDVIGLTGDLGSGKTSFARAFVRSLTGPDEEVPSPTFTLVQSYDADDRVVSHADLYRLEDPEEVWELGFEDMTAAGIVLIEWPDRLGPRRSMVTLDVVMAILPEASPTARAVTLRAGPAWRDRLGGLETDLAAFRHD